MTASLRPQPWTIDAACVNHPLGYTAFDRGTPAARAVCATCPVRLTCALEALADAIPTGMWGGLDETDRRTIAQDFGFDRPGAVRHGERACYVAGCRRPECREAHRRWAAGRRAQGAWTGTATTRARIAS